MKKIFYSFIFLYLGLSSGAQDWTWMKGPIGVAINGTYGTMGVSSASNFPGSRHGAVTWVDAAGMMWMFGGEGHGAIGPIGWVNDLWKYDPSTNNWTWVSGTPVTNQAGNYGVKGVAAPSNMPGGREFASSWKDAAGNFWMFGGDGWDALGNFGNLNDLWKYDPTTNQWTWMHGTNLCKQNGVYGSQGVSAAANMPGGRITAPAVIDGSGNMWLHGGYGFPMTGTNNGYLCDLWKYDPSINEWTWMKGLPSMDNNGTYGTINVPSPLNYPGGRAWSSMALDASGNFLFFGGDGYPQTGGLGYLNDVWRYLPSTNRWVWVNGSNAANSNGVYGTLGVSSPTNYPGARSAMAYWMDNTGKFWIFGGVGFPAAGGVGRMSDLMRYDITSNEWTWMKGPNTITQPGTYGAMGATTPTNNPGARYYNTQWKDNSGNLWIFGANGMPAVAPIGNLCDLWKYTLSCTPENISASSELVLCSGNSSTLLATSSGTGGINWYSSPTSTAVINTGSLFPTPTLTAAVGTDSIYSFYAASALCAGPRTPVSVTVHPLPSLTVTTSNTLLCTGQSSTLTANGAFTYSWSSGSFSNTSVVAPTVNTSYTVNGTDTNGCVTIASIMQNVSLCTGISTLKNENYAASVFPNPNSGNFVVRCNMEQCVFVVYNSLGQKILETILTADDNKINTPLQRGIYYYIIKKNEKYFGEGKLLIE